MDVSGTFHSQRLNERDDRSRGCALYPIALHQDSLKGAQAGDIVDDIANGAGRGNFGWLRWSGAGGEPTLITSLTPPGDSDTYTNPNQPSDHVVSVGDRVRGRPGVANSEAVRDALDRLKGLDITVPVWDDARGDGSTLTYQVRAFARVRLVDYHLPGQNRISVRFLGYVDCDAARPTATPTNSPTPTSAPTDTPTNTSTATPTDTSTNTPTNTSTSTPTDTPMSTTTPTPTDTPSNTNTPTPIDTSTNTPTSTPTDTPTSTTTPTPTDTPTDTPINTSTPTDTPTNTPNNTPTDTPTLTETPTAGTGIPVAVDDAYTVDENSSLSVPAAGTLANDTDSAGAPLTARLVTGAVSGTLTLNPDGSFTYVPKANFSGGDCFSYRASNGTLDSNVAVVRLTVTHVNGPPAIVSAAVTNAFVETPYRYDVDAADPDPGDTLTYTLEDGPPGMTIDSHSGLIQWAPGAPDLGEHSVAVRVADAAGLTDSQVFTLQVRNGPPAPLARDDSYAFDEDQAAVVSGPGVLANDLIPIDATVTARLATGPVHGTLVLTPDGSFRYTPAAPGFTGVDHFAYHADDGVHAVSTATVTITINPLPVTVPNVIGMAPLAATKTITETKLAVGNVTTIDGAITPSFDSLPSAQGWQYVQGYRSDVPETQVFSVKNKLLTLDTLGLGSFVALYEIRDVYDPRLPFTIAVRARILAEDGNLLAPPGHFEFGVMSSAGQYFFGMNAKGEMRANGRYITGVDTTHLHDYRFEVIPDVRYQLYIDDVLAIDEPVTGSSPYNNRIYMGDNTGFGNARAEIASYSFSQPRVVDQRPVGGTSVLKGSPVDLVIATGPSRVTVPYVVGMAQADAESTIAGARLIIGTVTTKHSVSVPAGHVISQKPVAGMSVAAGSAVSLMLSLGPEPNQAPVAADDSYKIDGGQTLRVPISGVLANDSDPNATDTLTSTLASPPVHGTLVLTPDGSFRYTPAAGFSGSDSFAYKASDGRLDSNVATVQIAVLAPVNNCVSAGVVPATTASYFTNPDAQVTYSPGEIILRKELSGYPNYGVVDGRSDVLYTGEAATWRFTLPSTIDPATVQSAFFRVAMIADDHYAVDLNAYSLAIWTNEAVRIAPGPARLPHGSPYGSPFTNWTERQYDVCLAPSAYSFTMANPSKTDSGDWEAVDWVELHLLVNGVNTPPVAEDDNFMATRGQTLSVAAPGVMANDRDPQGGALSARLATEPAHGTLTLNADGSFSYIPAAGYSGLDFFSYTASDGRFESNAALVTIRVQEPSLTCAATDNRSPLPPAGDGPGVWEPTSSSLLLHHFQTVTLLPTGTVLVVGGQQTSGPVAEIYNPQAATWTATGMLPTSRYAHSATLLKNGKVLIAGGLNDQLGALATAELYDPASNTWSSAGAMQTPRYEHTATLLNDGRVLVTGGYQTNVGLLSSAELYDPMSNTWSPTANMHMVRFDHLATLLTNGQVLVTGGRNGDNPIGIASTELYDPTSATWSFAASMRVARLSHTATLLPDGKLLVVGGDAAGTTERYDPLANTWTKLAPLPNPRSGHSATLLSNGRIVVVGGDGSTAATAVLYNIAADRWSSFPSPRIARAAPHATLLGDSTILLTGADTASAEIYRPGVAGWLPAAPMVDARRSHTATLLQNGKVLVTGGINLASAELYDPVTNSWSSAGTMSTPRGRHTATLLPDGRVLVVGGLASGFNGPALASAELYNPTTNSWSPAGTMHDARYVHTATLLCTGKVLVAGGYNGDPAVNRDLASAELYDPTTNSWSLAAPMSVDREHHTATLLGNGKVLVTGGFMTLNVPTDSARRAELYDPATDSWSPAGQMSTARAKHRAVLLQNGRVLVIGGYDLNTVFATTELYDPATNTWSSTASLHGPRVEETATLLGDGTVLVAGGADDANPVTTAERYDPQTDTWTVVAPLNEARFILPAALLDTGMVLLAGGAVNGSGALTTAELYDPRGSVTNPYPPLAADDRYTTNRDQSLAVAARGVLANDVSPAGGALTAVQDTGPAHGTLTLNADGSFRYTPDTGFAGYDSFSYTANDGALSSKAATVTIRVNRPPVITSTPITSTLVGDLYVYDVVASDPDAGDVLRFSLVAAPTGMAIDQRTGRIGWIPSSTQVGPHDVTVQVGDGAGGTATQRFTLTVAARPASSLMITSAPVVTATEGALYQYDVAATASDPPLAFALTTAPEGMGIDAGTGRIQWTPDGTQAGSYLVAVRVTDGRARFVTQRYVLTVAEAVNNPPIITSNPVTTATEGVPYQYAFSVFDPDDDQLSARLPVWPDGMTFDPATAAIVWTPDGTQAGIHQVQLEVNDGRGGVARQTFTINVAEAINTPPAFDSAPITSATVGRLYQYGAHAADADGDLLTYSLAGAPAGMTIRPETGLIEWTPDASQLGDQTVTVQVTDGRSVPVPQQFVIHVGTVADTTSPALNLAITPADIVVGQSVRFAVQASDNVGVTSLTLAVNGRALALDPSGQASFTPPAAGAYTATATARDAAGNFRTATAVFTVHDPADTTLPTARITTPDDDTVVETPLSVLGTASDDHLVRYELSVTPLGSDAATVVATGAEPVVDGVLGHVDPTLLQNGMYRLRLTVVDTGGNTASDERVIQVQGQAKVGIFTLSFTDLEVPLAGLPIQVIRTYDSRDKRAGDFGVGWTLDLKTVRLHENRVLGGDWQGVRSGGVLSRTYCIQETRRHVVTVTLPDGKALQFQPILMPQCQAFAPQQQVTLGFRPMPGTNATLAPATSPLLYPDGANPGEFNLVTDIADPAPYDPDQYVLTLQDGRQLRIDQQAGLQSVRDLNGNELTFSRDGISHSSGKSVTFSRDTQGRVTQVTDPNGGAIRYAYDGAGDLAHVTDQAGNTTSFTYNRNHDLLTIADPRGVQPIRNEYDESGRLVGHTDADGNRVAYTHDIGARQESVQDRLGHVTLYGYDLEGNVVSQTDALGHTTFYTYDVFGNKLSETDPLGHTTFYTYDERDNLLTQTDPLGHTTSYTYNERGQVLTTTDPLGRSTSNTYDPSGNLIETRDALGNVTSYAYDARGLQVSMTDALHHTTSYAYDPSGNLTTETDARGHSTSYAYDPNGNRVRQITTRTNESGVVETLTTSYAYDGLNRLVKTTYPDGAITETSYNSIGQQEVSTDQLGRQTTYAYDEQGRLIGTTYPDGAREESAYDAEGHRVRSTDRAGRATTYAYDAMGRLVTTTAPDGATTGTSYDEAGRTIAATDALGNVTHYEYDAVGRQVKVTNALSQTTTFAYDAAGNQVAMTDARGNTTHYEYDQNNRRTATVFPDGTRQETAYDDLGRSVAQTDQDTKTTSFTYDELGRLIAVKDALQQVTSYTYDEAGNQLTQTDANGHTTTFAYDAMGRRVRRTLPEGMAETYGYDKAGNLTSKTDFNGKTTTYAYDILSRLTAKTPDASLGQPAVRFTYTTSGQRASMADASGTTSYTYDARDRLLSKATPWGTLSYTYDANGNLRAIRSSHAGGASADYAYDALNRLASVNDKNLANGTTTYAYDENGNLAGYEYPNQTRTSYTYDTLNRLTDMSVARPAVTLASYRYTLGPSGNRLSVAELSGRAASYAYDDLYHLTGETIAGDPNGVNGAIGYSYDPVGNRLSRTSTVAPVPAASYGYDKNDRLTSDIYDANGNTVGSGGHGYAYDSENRLTSLDSGAATFVYDGDGNRVAKTVGGVTTSFLVDDRNPTGYAQVLEEIQGGAVVRSYTYGLDLVSQRQAGRVSFYGYDGHGSVRFLTDAAGNVTDRYDYDAFGILIHADGTTPNVYLYSGEQYDPSLALQYLRARYMKEETGRFWTMDGYEAGKTDPRSLHKYLYAIANPTNLADPTGHFVLPLVATLVGFAMSEILLSSFFVITRKSYTNSIHRKDILSFARQLQLTLGHKDDAKALAEIFGQAALFYTGTSIQDKTDFISDLQSILTEFDGPFHAIYINKYINLVRTTDEKDRIPVTGFGSEHFRTEYKEVNNQVRHFMGFVAAGYYGDYALGWIMLVRHEGWSISDTPDYRLGLAGLSLGQAIRNGSISLSETKPWIMNNIHD